MTNRNGTPKYSIFRKEKGRRSRRNQEPIVCGYCGGTCHFEKDTIAHEPGCPYYRTRELQASLGYGIDTSVVSATPQIVMQQDHLRPEWERTLLELYDAKNIDEEIDEEPVSPVVNTRSPANPLVVEDMDTMKEALASILVGGDNMMSIDVDSALAYLNGIKSHISPDEYRLMYESIEEMREVFKAAAVFRTRMMELFRPELLKDPDAVKPLKKKRKVVKRDVPAADDEDAIEDDLQAYRERIDREAEWDYYGEDL